MYTTNEEKAKINKIIYKWFTGKKEEKRTAFDYFNQNFDPDKNITQEEIDCITKLKPVDLRKQENYDILAVVKKSNYIIIENDCHVIKCYKRSFMNNVWLERNFIINDDGTITVKEKMATGDKEVANFIYECRKYTKKAKFMNNAFDNLDADANNEINNTDIKVSNTNIDKKIERHISEFFLFKTKDYNNMEIRNKIVSNFISPETINLKNMSEFQILTLVRMSKYIITVKNLRKHEIICFKETDRNKWNDRRYYNDDPETILRSLSVNMHRDKIASLIYKDRKIIKRIKFIGYDFNDINYDEALYYIRRQH